MNSWSAFQNSVSSLSAQIPLPDLNSTTAKLSTRFQTLSQTVKERTGAASLDITELPQGAPPRPERADVQSTSTSSAEWMASAPPTSRSSASPRVRPALRCPAHIPVYDTAYDYPSQLQESVTELSGSLVHNLSSLMAAATKGTSAAPESR